MLVTADIGNTNITLGIFDKDKYLDEIRIPSDRDLSKEEYVILLKSLLQNYKTEGCIISSVVEELSFKFKSAIDKVCRLDSLLLDCDLELGIKIKTDNPNEVGADRIANAVAVSDLYKGAVIVVDFGTATSFDIINSKKEFLGGIIAPGINTQMKCLNSSTSKLPKIDVSISRAAIGKNTTEAILSGVIRGTACMIDGLVEQCKQELNENVTVVATGGYCGLIANYLKTPFDDINPILTLIGMKKIYEMNKGKVKTVILK